MIVRNSFTLDARYYGDKAISSVYYGLRLVWEAIRSCFGKGCWVEGKPWVESDAWKEM